MIRKPLVLDDDQRVEQLQPQDQIPLADQVEALEVKLRSLANFLINQGIEVPETLMEQ